MAPCLASHRDLDLFYVGLLRDPTPPLRSAPLERSCRALLKADLPLRALHEPAFRGVLARDLNLSSFATRPSSAVENTAVCRGRNASCQRSGVIPTFLPQPHQQRATHFNSQCMLHAALLMPAYWQTSFRFAGRVARLRHDELHSGAPAAHPALGTGNSMHSSSLTADQVSWRVPLNSATLRSMLCCFCCLPAARALGLLPSASPRKSGDQSRTISPTVPVLADAIGSYSTRLHGGEGGSKATAAAPECLGARP